MVEVYNPCEKVYDGAGKLVTQIKAVGYCLPLSDKLRYDIQGRWSKSAKHGVQFEPVINGTIYNKPSRDSVIAAKYTLSGVNAAHESLYFLNPAIASNTWIPEKRRLCTIIGNHWFYY